MRFHASQHEKWRGCGRKRANMNTGYQHLVNMNFLSRIQKSHNLETAQRFRLTGLDAKKTAISTALTGAPTKLPSLASMAFQESGSLTDHFSALSPDSITKCATRYQLKAFAPGAVTCGQLIDSTQEHCHDAANKRWSSTLLWHCLCGSSLEKSGCAAKPGHLHQRRRRIA